MAHILLLIIIGSVEKPAETRTREHRRITPFESVGSGVHVAIGSESRDVNT